MTEAFFTDGKRRIQTKEVWQYDKGVKLCVKGVEGLNADTEFHFEVNKNTPAIVRKGVFTSADNSVTVDIPNRFLEVVESFPKKVWVYNAVGETGNTAALIQIPVITRNCPDNHISQDDLSQISIIQSAVADYFENNPTDYYEHSANKLDVISDGQTTDSDHENYPSVYAVKEYVGDRLSDAENYADEQLEFYYTKDEVDNKGYLTQHQDISGKADKSTTLSGYGITNAYTKTEVDSLLSNFGQINIVSSVSEMTDTSKYYILESTGHIWVYMQSGSGGPEDKMNVQTGNLNMRITTSGAAVASDGCFVADLIPVDLTSPCPVTLKGFSAGMGASGTANYGNSRISAFDSQGNHLLTKYIARSNSNVWWACSIDGDDCKGDLCDFTLNTQLSASDIKFIRFAPQISSNALTSSDLQGLEILFESSAVSEWTDTGISLINGRTEYPSYWKAEIDDTVGKIKALQEEHGQKLLCFGWLSDMHIHPTGLEKEKYIGAVAAEVMNQCGMPLLLITGDIFSNSSSWTKAQTGAAYKKAFEYLSPVPEENMMIIRGNHDAWFGSTDNQYYTDGLSPNEVYRYLFLPQAKDLRRVFGGDGSYFYLDDMPHKTRFICLNSQWADFTRDSTSNLPLYNTQKHAGFGQDQFDWLIESLDVPQGYSVVVAMHTPPSDSLADSRSYVTGEGGRDLAVLRGILTAYCNKTTYSGTYTHSKTTLYGYEGAWADVSVSCNFSSYNGTLRGIFCGHSHYDQFTTSDLPAPIVCITCAADSPYDVSASTRVQGTSNETAIDFVCLNLSTGKIDLIRCGCGSDRTVQ